MSPPSSKRKRHSAFDDFPVEKGAHEETQLQSTVLQNLGESIQPTVERIERLKPSQIIPDQFQPRRLLPMALREEYFSGKIDCYQAATSWLSLARQDKGYREEIDRLLSMGSSFEDHGQIKPITGSWVSTSDGRYLFLIETGERRFWAACLMFAANKQNEEPLLRVEVVKNPSRQRQVLENRHAEPPSSVGQACEIASLILDEIGIRPTVDLGDEYDYFRGARSQRMPVGLWEKIKPIMQLTRPRMVQLLNILQLPTPLLELADRYRLPERVLREILSLPGEQWEQMILLSIQKKFTSNDKIEIAATSPNTLSTKRHASPNRVSRKPPSLLAVSGLRRFANTVLRLDQVNQTQALDEMADELIVSGDAGMMLALFEELSSLISSRLKRL